MELRQKRTRAQVRVRCYLSDCCRKTYISMESISALGDPHLALGPSLLQHPALEH